MPPFLPADDLIARCRRVYAECETYADEGEHVTRVELPSDGARQLPTLRTSFRTRWKRPDRLRIDVRGQGAETDDGRRHGVLWSTPTGIVTWTGTARDGDLFVRHMAGISLSSVLDRTTLVLGMLRAVPDRSTSWASSNSEPVDLDGICCFGADVSVPNHLLGLDDLRVWIGERDSLVRRIDSVEERPNGPAALTVVEKLRGIERQLLNEAPASRERDRVLAILRAWPGKNHIERFIQTETTTFRPRLDVPLDDAEFDFRPPAEGA